MKKLITILFAVNIIMTGCNSKKLDKQTAKDAIKKEQAYPKILDYDIYCNDPEHARKMRDAGLEKEGLVIIQQTQKLSDVGKPIIEFTAKAQPYLLSTSEKDKTLNIQKIKLADEDLAEIISIKEDGSGNSAEVTYTTTYKNITPFSVLVNKDFNTTKEHKVNLALHEDNWQMEKSSKP